MNDDLCCCDIFNRDPLELSRRYRDCQDNNKGLHISPNFRYAVNRFGVCDIESDSEGGVELAFDRSGDHRRRLRNLSRRRKKTAKVLDLVKTKRTKKS